MNEKEEAYKKNLDEAKELYETFKNTDYSINVGFFQRRLRVGEKIAKRIMNDLGIKENFNE